MENALHTGHGRVKPLDTEEVAEVCVVIRDNVIESACFLCSEDNDLIRCLKTLCEILKDKPAADIFQMNNNCIYYNLSYELPRNRLYCASMAVLAAKRAVSDWCKKNGLEVPGDGCGCV